MQKKQEQQEEEKENWNRLSTLKMDNMFEITSFLNLDDMFHLSQATPLVNDMLLSCKKYVAESVVNIQWDTLNWLLQYDNVVLDLPVKMERKYGEVSRKKNGYLHSEEGNIPSYETSSGTKFYHWYGKLHRPEKKGPAIDGKNEMIWMKCGQQHRSNGKAARIKSNGLQEWCENGRFHRIGDLPAKITKQFWKYYEKGKLHRANGLPAVVWRNGTKKWYVRGKLHREDGLPAIESCDGTKKWYVKGKLHREDGLPAVVKANGIEEWWLNGVQYNLTL
jgi:hypothetical protein